MPTVYAHVGKQIKLFEPNLPGEEMKNTLCVLEKNMEAKSREAQ